MYNFFINFELPQIPLTESQIERVFRKILEDHRIKNCEIGLILVDQDYIADLNMKYFNKNYPTDVISFPLSDDKTKCLEGEIYVCAEVAQQQATEYQITWNNELMRLAIHGLLHLLDYKDYSSVEKKSMTQKEDYYLEYIG